jgi:hypothetical protein
MVWTRREIGGGAKAHQAAVDHYDGPKHCQKLRHPAHVVKCSWLRIASFYGWQGSDEATVVAMKKLSDLFSPIMILSRSAHHRLSSA